MNAVMNEVREFLMPRVLTVKIHHFRTMCDIRRVHPMYAERILDAIWEDPQLSAKSQCNIHQAIQGFSQKSPTDTVLTIRYNSYGDLYSMTYDIDGPMNSIVVRLILTQDAYTQ
jgi:hypothetical protein